MGTAEAWTELTTTVRDVEALEGALGLLEWDQQTMMPRRGASGRGAQIAALAKVLHERVTQPKVGDFLTALEGGPLDEVQAAGVRNLRRTYNRATRVPQALVGQIAEAQSDAFNAWLGAKQSSDFASFAPKLEKLMDLVRERSVAIDDKSHPYDVLLDEFDPGTTMADLRVTFARLQKGLGELLSAVRDHADFPVYDHPFDVTLQRGLHKDVLTAMGFDFDAGRLDDAEHPFSLGLHPDDVRITTHVYPTDLLASLWGTIHEGGHALYEQGLPTALRGTTVAKPASFGLHESQSRFWENYIGRSRPYCEWLAGRIHARFPDAPADPERLYQAANRIHPGLIRIKADEVTYNLHIIVRFELEVMLFDGKLAVRDLPEAWNERYRQYLGVTPRNHAEGVLQDVHWSSGAIGYFPSYTLGNLYAASLGKVLETRMPDLWDRVGKGDLLPIREWLRENVHRRGTIKLAPAIIKDVVGEQDLVENLLSYLWGRHGVLYGVKRPL
jgi:carboxypeptidase Taq